MLTLFYVEVKRSWLGLIRYPMEAVAVLIMLVAMFYGLFLGAGYIAGPVKPPDGRLESIVVGYVAWMLTMGVFNGISGDITTEIQTGTLEQIFIARKSFLTVTLVRSLANLGVNMVITLAMMFFIMLLTSTRLSFSLDVLIPLAIVITGSIGLGMIMGGVTIVMKRTRGILGIAQFGLIFLMMAPFETFSGAKGWLDEILPIAKGTGLLRQTMALATKPELTDILIAAGNSLAYLIIGCVLFSSLIARAKRQGTLTHY